MDRIRIRDLVRETGLSRATIDRAMNGRGGVHPETERAIEAARARLRALQAGRPHVTGARPRLDLLIRLGRGLTDQFANAMPSLAADVAMHDMHQRSEAEILAQVQKLCEDIDTPLIIAAKNDERLCAELSGARQRGKRVVTVISDLHHGARDSFVGIDNRQAGQTVAHLIGGMSALSRHPKVAVVLGDYAFRCHEDREIGFRSQLRAANPEIEIAEAAKGEDSPEQTYLAVKRLLERHPDLGAIYNVAGGNLGLARALEERGLAGRILLVTHEANHITVPLLQSGAIKFVIAQNPTEILQHATQAALSADPPKAPVFVNFGIHTAYNIPDYGSRERLA